VFTAAPFSPPKKLRTKPSLHRRMGALVIFLILLGSAGTLALVAASIVFAIYQVQFAMRPTEVTHHEARGGGGGGFVPMPLDPDDKPPASEKAMLQPLELLPSPPEFTMPAATQKPMTLNRRHSIGEFSITLQTWLEGQEKSSSGTVARLKSRTIAEFLESIQAVDPEGQASVCLRYRGYRADSSRDGVSRTLPLAASADLASASAFMLVNEKGEPSAHRLDTTHVPAASDGTVRKVHETQRLLLEFLTIPLPNETAAKPGALWTYQRQIPLLFSEDEQTVRTMDVTATLKGSQRVGTTDFAVLELRGTFANAKEGEVQDQAMKQLKGWALIDQPTGNVMKADIEVPFAVALASSQSTRSISGTYRLALLRRVPPPLEDNN
jgi:hypothetical protein